MSRRFRVLLVGVALAFSALALALYPKLSNTLIGVPYNGSTPSGSIKVDQSKLNAAPAKVEVSMQGINVPDGTYVGFTIDNEFYGTLPVVGRRVNGSISTFLQTGRNAAVYVSLPDGTVVAYATQSWKT